jgi:hypothetical protein
MKRMSLCSVLIVLVAGFAWSQSQQSTPNNAENSLANVHKLYIEPMGGVDSKGRAMNLQDYLKVELEKQMGRRIEIVPSKDQADAVMSGTGSWANTVGAAVTGRLMGLHDTAMGAISVEKNGTILWSSEAGDRSLWWGVLARGGPRKVASRLAGKFKAAVEKADKDAHKRS